MAQQLSAHQRLQPLRHEQPSRLGLDVPLRTPGLGHRLYVPDLLAGLLARADRNHRVGPRAHSSGKPGSLEGQARCSLHRSSSFGGSGSLHRGLYPHLRRLPNRLHLQPLRLRLGLVR